MLASIFSDNGGAFLKSEESLPSIRWKLNPPLGPHHGGLWEVGVKSAKRLLLEVTKNVTMTYEEYSTLFTQIEAVLNSRPLSKFEYGYVTPGPFLTGSHILEPPEEFEASVFLETRYQLVAKLFQDFRIAWSGERVEE